MFDYSKLRGLIVEKYGTVMAFAEKTDNCPQAIYNKLSNRAAFTREDIVKWCNLLDIDQDNIGLYFFTLKV